MQQQDQVPSMIPTVTGNIYPANDTIRKEVVTVNASSNTWPEQCVEVKYSNTRVIGNGSFGVVYVARLCDNSNTPIAIKKVYI